MTAQIINLADRRRGAAPSRLPEPIDLLRDIAARLGLPPLEEEPAPPPPQRPTIMEMIQEIAGELGIDIEAPFRQPPQARPFVVPPRPGDKKPPKPRKERAT